MKKLIKRILKEETLSQNDINKGINIAVNFLKKKYPFIVGWEQKIDTDKFVYTIYINLELDFEKSKRFYNLKPHPIYGMLIQDYIKNRNPHSYPYSMMDYEIKDFDLYSYKNLEDDLSDIYNDMVPNQFKPYYRIGKGVLESYDFKKLNVDNYIFVK